MIIVTLVKIENQSLQISIYYYLASVSVLFELNYLLSSLYNYCELLGINLNIYFIFANNFYFIDD